MEFLEEKIFDREQYDTYIRRIHYDDRDAVMYEKMLHFLFPYIVEERGIEDKEGLMEEYIHWNGQLIEKCLYHLVYTIHMDNIHILVILVEYIRPLIFYVLFYMLLVMYLHI